MAARLYADYVKVDPNFIPVFSRNMDRTYPDKWQSFYPHDSFKRILKDVVETLEKGSETKDRSVWMSGAYGTGKTYASFVIKHILEDDIDAISAYFIQNGMESLLARVKGIRAKGNVIVVHKSSSAGINTQDKLFYSIVESVRSAVADSGFSYTGAESLSSKIISILKHPETSAFNFQGAFNKYRGKFTAYNSVDDIITDLEDLDLEDRLELLDTIIDVAAQEGFYWSMSTDEIIEWLEDIRKGNNLYAIVFIWDEFTEYFRNNQNNITGLQEIAQASSRINFYLFLITHSSASQLIHDKGSKTIIEARFKLDTIELEERTAFKLLGQAIHIEPDLADEWEKTKKQLWSDVKRGTVDIIKDRDFSIQDDDFGLLLPMHPYAAYLLKFIAKDISSNQRTIFQFLSGDYSGEDHRTNFKWFIEAFSYEYGKWNYLTVDYLWDYFFQANNVDLDSSFLQVISHYNNYAPICDDPDNSSAGERRKRALKVTLLLVALQEKNGAEAKTGAISLMRPTLKNIQACFAGTPQETSIVQDLNFFTSKGIMSRLESAKEVLFVMSSASVDTERMEQIKEETKKAITFEKLITDPSYKIADQFSPADYLKYRLQIIKITPANARKEAQNFQQTPNHIPTFFLFARNEAEQGKVKDTISEVFSEIGSNCIVVDFSSLPFTDAMFDKFIDGKAREKYFSSLPNQKSQVNLAKKTAQDLLDEWTRKLVTTSLYVYSDVETSEQVVGGANLRKKFKEINTNRYGSGLEEISQNDKLFAEIGFKATVAQMAMGKIDVPNNYSYIRAVHVNLERDGIWDTSEYWKKQPTHPVSKMKFAIEQQIQKDFDKSAMASITDIWKILEQPPFGLLPNTGSVFLLGFLLRDYADTTYYKSDVNNNTVFLNYNDLSELIFGAVKKLPKVNGQFIVKQTPEQIEFCRITGEIFKISKDKRNSVDDIVKNVNIFLRNNKFPMWSMKYFIEEDETLSEHEYRDPMIQLTELICEFIRPESKIGRERSKIVEDIFQLYSSYSTIETVYTDILTPANMRTGMGYYIAQYKPDIISIAGSLKLEPKEYLDALSAKLSDDASYLWEIGDTNRQIENLYIDLRLIQAINRVLTTSQKTYDSARKSLIEKLNIVKIPLALLKQVQPDIIPVIDQFNLIRENASFDKLDTAKRIEAMSEDFVHFFNNQFDTFCKAVDTSLNTTVDDEERDYLFHKVPSAILFAATDRFTTAMQHELDIFRKSKKTRQMYDAWEIATGSKTPSEWSKQHGIPVLCLYTDDILKAQKIFAALNKSANLPTEQDIDEAISFLQSGNLDILKNNDLCEQRFMDFFAGEYSYVITSADMLKEQLHSIAGDNVYDWYAKASGCRNKIYEYAKKCYQSQFSAKAKEQIKKLTAEEAQKYLDQLIETDPLLGIRILKGQ